MARKTFEEKIEEWKSEEESSQGTQVDETTESTEQETTPEPTPEPEPAPAEETNTEPEPAPEPEKKEEPESTPAMEEIENTNSIIRHRLEKQAKKFEDEKAQMKAEWDATFDERLKAAVEAEIKKRAEKQHVKTRDEFDTDEKYVAYLTQQQINADREEQQRIQAEKDAEAEKAKKEQEQAEETVRQRQKIFMNNVEDCFEGEDRAKFLSQVQYATKKGLGELLDSCPIASDYLLSNRNGPKVLNKLLNDREAFLRVFDPRGISPMDQYSELKEIERSLGKEAPAPAEPPAATAPKLGKPGAQGASSSMDTFSDPKARREWARKVMGY